MLRVDTAYIKTAELAARWKRSAYIICEYAKQGRIGGAVKEGNEWRFPENAVLGPASKKHWPASDRMARARDRLDQLKREARGS